MASPDPRLIDPASASLPAKWHVAILTYGNLAETKRCLASLEATVDEPFVVHVIDNASSDGTQQWLRSCGKPWLRVRCNEANRGVPGGRNDLLAFALPNMRPDDWLVFCDNDLEFTTGWLAKYRDAMRQFPNARMLGQVGHLVQVLGERRALLPAFGRTRPVDVLSGGFACMVRADVAAAIGPFDEKLGLFWHEDDDWSVRALQLGVELVAVPDAGVVHHEHASGVATDCLRDGGSLKNQAYLCAKWRGAGIVDEGGWVRQSSAHYKPPTLRAELQRRCGRLAPIGRAEMFAAADLLDRLVGATDPLAELGARPEPLPQCFGAWLSWNRETAASCGAAELVVQLDRVAEASRRGSLAARILPSVKLPSQSSAGPVGNGVCASSDFDDPEWLAVADAMEPGHATRDPYARDLVFWQDTSVLLALRRAGVARTASTLLLVGRAAPRLVRALQAMFERVVDFDPASPPAEGSCSVALLLAAHVPYVMAPALRACRADATVVVVGEACLDGAPTALLLQPMQLEHELGPRTGLVPLWPIRTAVDPALLEACAFQAGASHGPKLCTLGERLTTGFVVAFRRQAVGVEAVVKPTHPWLPIAARAVLGVDMRTVAYADSTARGIGHYAIHHLAAIARRAPDLRIACYLPEGRALPGALSLPNVEARDVDTYSSSACDLMHIPDPMNLAIGFDSPLRVFRHPCTTVLFHDLTPLHHYVAQWPASNRDAYLDRLRQIEKSDATLLCNSAFTAADAVRTLGIEPARAIPVLAGWNGQRSRPDARAIAATKARLGIRGPFVLHVGALDPHKNFAASLSAFVQVRARRPLQFVVVGAVDPGIEQFASLCSKKRIPDVLFTGFLPRADLDALYADAAALLFLSKAEGFGFPLLEAMAAGCPVIGSDATSHPEVVGEAGLLVPLDGAAEHAKNALLRVLSEPGLAATLRDRGLRQATMFDWDDVADRTIAAWDAMLESSRQRAALPSFTNV